MKINRLPVTKGRPRKPPCYQTPLDLQAKRTLTAQKGRPPTPGELAAYIRKLKRCEGAPLPAPNKSAKNRFILEINTARALDPSLSPALRRRALNAIKASDLV